MKTKEDEMYEAGYNCATATALEFLDRLFLQHPIVTDYKWEEDFRKDFIKAMAK